jgi:glyoxylase-like metal-dependent hydrolase (beta-lactamase superfamily II)
MKHAHPLLPDGVHVFERGWLSSNTVLFEGSQPAVVDTGYVSHAELGLELVRHALDDVAPKLIVNTHLHSDHCGGNALLQSAYPLARTLIPAHEAEAAIHWDEARLSFEATGQRCPRFRVDGTYAVGDKLKLGDLQFEAVAAPGHDPRMMVLWCEAHGLLISADALWEDGFGIVFPEIEGGPGFCDVRATLDLIASFDAQLVLPGHGAPFTDVPEAIARACQRLDYLEADPTRNARHALKVLVKFLLLDEQSMLLASLPVRLANMRYAREINHRFLHLRDEAALAEWVVQALAKTGAARVEQGTLHNN